MAVELNTQPWWFSGDEVADDARRPSGGVDFGALAAGASQVVDWARSLIVAPHAEHLDPRDHPQCVICQATRFMGVVSDPSSAPSPRPEVEWIDVDWR